MYSSVCGCANSIWKLKTRHIFKLDYFSNESITHSIFPLTVPNPYTVPSVYSHINWNSSRNSKPGFFSINQSILQLCCQFICLLVMNNSTNRFRPSSATWILNPSTFLLVQVIASLFSHVLQGSSVHQCAPWGSTKPTASLALPSAPRSSWPWRGSSVRSSTCPSQSGPSSPPPCRCLRPRSRSGSRTDERRPRGFRRPRWRNSK